MKLTIQSKPVEKSIQYVLTFHKCSFALKLPTIYNTVSYYSQFVEIYGFPTGGHS